MPIINPKFFPFYWFYTKDENQFLNFFLIYLRIASHNIYRNFKTLETAIKFHKDICESIQFLQLMGCQITENELNDPSINNIYKLIYHKINLPEQKKKTARIKGNYVSIDNIKYFYFHTFSNYNHAWFLTDTPVAILCVTSGWANIEVEFYLYKLKLEIDLMVASGYKIVFYFKDDGHLKDFYFNLINENQFSEIHYYIRKYEVFNKYNICKFLQGYQTKYHFNFEKLSGYFYFYLKYSSKKSNDYLPIFEKLKSEPHVRAIIFSCDILNNTPFEKSIIRNIAPFPYCKNGFDYKYLRVLISNYPLYDSDDINESFTPSSSSGVCYGYILQEDFLNMKNFRVPIFIDDDKIMKKFINFDDIHNLKPDLFVENQLSLAKISQKTFFSVKTIESDVNEKLKKRFNISRKDQQFSLIKLKRIQNNLQHVSYAYYYSKALQGEKFIVHNNQIFTAFEACKQFFFKSNDPTQKGIVFQVDTGEGKSCIVCLIAAVLAKMGKTIHIASSNIKLSLRDFEKSHQFFELLGIKSAALVHSNELPIPIKRKFNLDEKTETNLNIRNYQNENNQSLIDEESKSETENFFKDNMNNYYKKSAFKTDSFLEECYSEEFFNSSLFKNSSRINYSICGLDEDNKESANKADVIFSTFVNFECFYLKMIELCPGYVESYFTKCGLLIDEADSILIDEIANGTIISRAMKSNAIEILKFVYEKKQEGFNYDQTFSFIKKNPNWASCKDLTKEHIKQMYKEIDLVHTPEYSNGMKYCIETKVVTKSKKKNRLIQEALNLSKDIAITIVKDFVSEFSKDINKEKEDQDKKEEEDDDDDDDDDDDEDNDEEEEEEENDESPIAFKYIVPFGYNHNGILERNKEFSGFIQQFIAIKESIDNKVENMLVNEVTMSYLYVSHPIFVKLYGTVCGFTGTVGSQSDKDLLRDQYGLTTLTVPRYKPNQRVEFPMILCESNEERNQKIASEVIEFHKRGNPVLVIFQTLQEIYKVEKLLLSQGIKIINIFDGKDDSLKPDFIAGINGAVSLGTNVCGRGTDIKTNGNPLHVIVSYYSSNIRVMKQAFGRTGRQGKKGTYRVICLKTQFYSPTYIYGNVASSINEFEIKNQRQREFVDYFKKKRSWIFTNYIRKQKINGNYLQELRKAKINVNRIVAYNYKFPICMSKETFLIIQEQKIFSLFNCPNSQFTWKLFQRYIREMILESWSLLINEIDQKYINQVKSSNYDKDIIEGRKQLYKQLNYYLPEMTDLDIVSTFMHIYRNILTKYEKSIIKSFKKIDTSIGILKKIKSPYLEFDKSSFFSCHAGFKPYVLYSNSGARILSKNLKKTNFITDPELKYEQRTLNKKITLASITSKIDDLFEKILAKINEIIGEKTFLKLFLRRTLAGCELGFCINLDLKSNNEEFDKENTYCIIDRDPLIVFTIFVRSLIPILAIILISLLTYLAIITKKIAKWFTFPSNVKESLKKTASIVVNAFASNISQMILEKIMTFLLKNLNKNIEQLKSFDEKNGAIIESLKDLFDSIIDSDISKKLSNKLGSLFKVKTNWRKLIKSCIDPKSIMKISCYLLLLVASFIMNFRYRKIAIEDYTTKSIEYHNDCNETKLQTMIEVHKNDSMFDNNLEIEENRQNELVEIDKSFSVCSTTFEFKMSSCNINDFLIKKYSDIIFDKQTLIRKNNTTFINCILKNGQKCIRIHQPCIKQAFYQEVRFYVNLNYPSILKLFGYRFKNAKQYLFVECKDKGTLDDFISQNLNLTQKLIISYGIARAIQYLHNNNIVYRNVEPLNIFLDSNFYPYLYNFSRARQIKYYFPFFLKKMAYEYMPPEFISDYEKNQDSFKIDVYSFGITLFYLITEKKPYIDYSKDIDDLLNDVINGFRPEFPDDFPVELMEWKKLIINCWNQDPSKRPSFDAICLLLESTVFAKNGIDSKKFLRYKEFLENEKG